MGPRRVVVTGIGAISVITAGIYIESCFNTFGFVKFSALYGTHRTNVHANGTIAALTFHWVSGSHFAVCKHADQPDPWTKFGGDQQAVFTNPAQTRQMCRQFM